MNFPISFLPSFIFRIITPPRKHTPGCALFYILILCCTCTSYHCTCIVLLMCAFIQKEECFFFGSPKKHSLSFQVPNPRGQKNNMFPTPEYQADCTNFCSPSSVKSSWDATPRRATARPPTGEILLKRHRGTVQHRQHVEPSTIAETVWIRFGRW